MTDDCFKNAKESKHVPLINTSKSSVLRESKFSRTAVQSKSFNKISTVRKSRNSNAVTKETTPTNKPLKFMDDFCKEKEVFLNEMDRT